MQQQEENVKFTVFTTTEGMAGISTSQSPSPDLNLGSCCPALHFGESAMSRVAIGNKSANQVESVGQPQRQDIYHLSLFIYEEQLSSMSPLLFWILADLRSGRMNFKVTLLQWPRLANNNTYTKYSLINTRCSPRLPHKTAARGHHLLYSPDRPRRNSQFQRHPIRS